MLPVLRLLLRAAPAVVSSKRDEIIRVNAEPGVGDEFFYVDTRMKKKPKLGGHGGKRGRGRRRTDYGAGRSMQGISMESYQLDGMDSAGM